jgi:hypothetical protein
MPLAARVDPKSDSRKPNFFGILSFRIILNDSGIVMVLIILGGLLMSLAHLIIQILQSHLLSTRPLQNWQILISP